MTKTKVEIQDNLKTMRAVKRARALLDRLEEKDALELSDKMLSTRVRMLIPRAIKCLSSLLDSQNESIRLKASQVLINKIMPDMKAITVENKTDISGLVIVRHDNHSTTIDISHNVVDGESLEENSVA